MLSLSRVHPLKRSLTPAGAKMNIHIKCGPVVFELRDFCNKSPFETRWWRLDPFATDSPSDNTVTINFNKTDADLTGFAVVNQEKDGFYSREVLKANGATVCRLIRNSTGETALSVGIDSEYKTITLIEDNTQTDAVAVFEFIGRYAMHAMIEYGVLPFHGVLMEHNGKGIIICAPSGVGKTTHARLWRDKKNALIINGDNACCHKENGVWKGFGIPWCGTSGESVNRSAEIAAIVVLERGAENKVHRLEEYDAFCKLLPLIHYPLWSSKNTSVATELCTEFLKDIPAFRLECKPDAQAVETLFNELEGVYGG